MALDPGLVRLMGFGIAAVVVGGAPGVAIITIMTGVEAYHKRKQKLLSLHDIADNILINKLGA